MPQPSHFGSHFYWIVMKWYSLLRRRGTGHALRSGVRDRGRRAVGKLKLINFTLSHFWNFIALWLRRINLYYFSFGSSHFTFIWSSVCAYTDFLCTTDYILMMVVQFSKRRGRNISSAVSDTIRRALTVILCASCL